MGNFDISKHPIIFETPKRIVAPYFWVGHIPFAFFLVSFLKPQRIVELGVHSGNSYNAFCQAVSTLNTETTCYGIDTWKGDKYTGSYGEEVYQELFRYQQQEYSDFSYLLKMPFDEALKHFSDNSIDVLHIDGYHTYEAVRHDFETWLPKMQKKGIILLHDTQVEERNFGVWKLWEETSSKYCSFEFTHNYGLGILILNKEMDRGLASFFDEWQQSNFYKNLFARLGNAVMQQKDQQIIHEKDRLIATLQNEVQLHTQVIQTQDTEIQQQALFIQEIKKTWSWKITAPLRMFWNLLCFVNSRLFLLNILDKTRFKTKKTDAIIVYIDKARLRAGNLYVTGWAIAQRGIESVEVYWDSRFAGNAGYGEPRPDVANIYPNMNSSSHAGFTLAVQLSDLLYDREEHTVVIRARDRQGRQIETFKTVRMTPNILSSCDHVELYSDALIVSGWVFSDEAIERVEAYLDGYFVGNAEYGLARPDIAHAYPNMLYSGNSGYHLSSYIHELKNNSTEHIVVVTAISYEGKSTEIARMVPQKTPVPTLNSINSNFYPSPKITPITSHIDGSKSILIVDHNIGGGTNIYRRQLIEKTRKNGRNIFLATYSYLLRMYNLDHYFKDHQAQYMFIKFDELLNLIRVIKVQEVVINSLVSYPEPIKVLSILKRIKALCHCQITLSIHDYYAVCPSHHLLNDKRKYCGIPHIEECKQCMQNNTLHDILTQYNDVETWRKEWGALLGITDTIICFSNSSIQIIKKAYPFIHDNKFEIIPHTVEDIQPVTVCKNSNIDTCNLGVLGKLTFQKGSQIIKSMVETIEARQLTSIKIIIIGQIIDEEIQSPHLTITGEYKRSDLVDLVKKHQIDMFFIPSICPETFSLTTEEVIKMNLPVAVFDLGAPAERVKNYKKGLIIKKVDANLALEKILHWFEK